MEPVLSSFIWKAFNWLPGFILRLIFNESWLKKNIYIDIKPRGSSVEIIQPDNPRVRIYFEIRNNTHFNIVLDRLIIKFIYGIEMASPTHFKRELIKPGKQLNLIIYGDIETSRFKSLAFHYQNNSSHCEIELHAEFNSKIMNFSIERRLDDIKPDIMNAHLLEMPTTTAEVSTSSKSYNS
jgi:hypothetical protein